MRVLIFVLCLLAVVLAPMLASSTSIAIYENEEYIGSFIDAYEGVVTMYVIVIPTSGLNAVWFAAPPPDCLTGMTLINEYSPFLKIGSVTTGVSVAFGMCCTYPVCAMTLLFVSSGIDSCCPYKIFPHPMASTGTVEGVDCANQIVTIHGETHTVRPPGQTGCGSPTKPSNPWPPDGAVDQPDQVTLDWDSEPTAGTGCGVFFANVHFGTSEDPPIRYWNIDPPQEAGPLEPNTTYYWKVVSIVTSYGSTVGPLWHFTTGSFTPVKSTTWGAIKALYGK
jgi:hypothetical protein